MKVTVQTSQKRQIVDITDLVNDRMEGDGLVNILALHTTTAITLADLDPGTDQDFLTALPRSSLVNANRPIHQSALYRRSAQIGHLAASYIDRA